jgi:hypothetical protein
LLLYCSFQAFVKGEWVSTRHELLLEEVIPVYSHIRNSNPTLFVVNDSSEKEHNNCSVISKTILSSLSDMRLTWAQPIGMSVAAFVHSRDAAFGKG